jgi:hypothetical protein
MPDLDSWQILRHDSDTPEMDGNVFGDNWISQSIPFCNLLLPVLAAIPSLARH